MSRLASVTGPAPAAPPLGSRTGATIGGAAPATNTRLAVDKTPTRFDDRAQMVPCESKAKREAGGNPALYPQL